MSEPLQENPGLVAGIVLYNPDRLHLLRLVEALAPDVERVLVYANSPVDKALAGELADAAGRHVEVLGTGENLGLGVAYNAFLAAAEAGGHRALILFDQDSLPQPGMARALLDLRDGLARRGETPAAVGPSPVDVQGSRMRVARERGGRTLEEIAARAASFIISSGSLLDVRVARRVGPFREDFFIDGIDIEWCFRARAQGFSIWIGTAILMDHRLGSGIIKLPLGLMLTDQPPHRIYTYLRNQLAMMRMSHVPLGYKVKIGLTMPVRIVVYLSRSLFARPVVRAVSNGLADGLRNRLERRRL